MTICAIVPAFNEAQLLPATLHGLRCIQEISRIIVVDDGSKDNTTTVARNYTDSVITLPYNMGKGEALLQGVQATDADILLFIDGDLGKSAELASYLFQPVLKGLADMSVAVFPPSSIKAGVGIVKGVARWGIYQLTGCMTKAPLSGQRALTREAADLIRSWDSRFGIEVGMTIDILRGGRTLLEVPVAFSHRETGRNWSGFCHRGKQCWDIGRMLGRKWDFQ